MKYAYSDEKAQEETLEMVGIRRETMATIENAVQGRNASERDRICRSDKATDGCSIRRIEKQKRRHILTLPGIKIV